jgi:hypothetical protein
MDKVKQIQEQAWKIITTPEYWFRRHYNLPPTDPRYLEATREDMIMDFYCHMMYDKYQQLASEGVKDIDMDTVMIEDQFEQELAKIKHEEEEKELIIDFKG